MAKKLEVYRIDLGQGRWMFRASDGGPIRFGVTGRKWNTTHLYPSSKVRNHILPAESDAELNVMFLLDVSTSVLTYMAQPHTLAFSTRHSNRLSRYTPDLEVIVPRWFVRELEKGTPFAIAALKVPQNRAADDDLVHLVIEVKGASRYRDLAGEERAKDEKRAKKFSNEQKAYDDKLKEAHAIYRDIGFYFYLVEEVKDLECTQIAHIPSVLVDDTADLAREKSTRAWDYLEECGGETTYGSMIDLLGGAPFGREAANRLHVLGHIWIDLFENPKLDAKVKMPPLLGSRAHFAPPPSIDGGL